MASIKKHYGRGSFFFYHRGPYFGLAFFFIILLCVPLRSNACTVAIVDQAKKSCANQSNCAFVQKFIEECAQKQAAADVLGVKVASDIDQKYIVEGGGNPQKTTTGINTQAIGGKQKLDEILKGQGKVTDEFRGDAVKAADERLKFLSQSRGRPDDGGGVNLKREKSLVVQAEKAARDRKPFPIKKAESASDPEVRRNLVYSAMAYEAKEEIESKRKKNGLEIAQLLQMAATTMQAATAMNSLGNSGPIDSAGSSSGNSEKAGLSNRSPASLGDKIEGSSRSPEELAEAEAAGAKAEKDEKTKEQIKGAIEAAEKRKKILALRLKNKLRENMKDKLAKGEKLEGVDTEELFGGGLTSGVANEAGAEDERNGSEKYSSNDSPTMTSAVFQAVKDGFSLAGPETDQEVDELVEGVQRELSSEEMAGGVLGRESPSLFERVHSIHQSCLREKCVLPVSKSASR